MIPAGAVQVKSTKSATASKTMKYKHISQKPYCCVPACIQMILQRRKLPILLQTDIAYDLGIILSSQDRHLLPKSHKGQRPKAGWGTRINLKRYSLSTFFKKREYYLKEIFQSAKKFSSVMQFKKCLLEKIKEKNDLLICFNYPMLYHIKGSWGHASLIERVGDDKVILRDPNPKHKELREVLLNDLLVALKSHHHGGIWLIKSLR